MASASRQAVNVVARMLDFEMVQRDVAWPHELARETFITERLVVRTPEEFKRAVTGYVQHHTRAVYKRDVAPGAAFGLALELLKEAYPAGAAPDGATAALLAATGRSAGGLGDVIGALARAMKGRAIMQYLENVFYTHVDPLSKAERLAVSRAFVERVGGLLKGLGRCVEEQLVAGDTLGAMIRLRAELRDLLVERSHSWSRF